MTRYTYTPGKVDANGCGRKINAVDIKWELKDGRFSMTGAIWNGSHTDWQSGGQNLEEIAELFPNNAKVQRMVAIWRRWHLNDMKAGTPAQEAIIEAHKDEFPGYPASHYTWACELLKANDLYEDNGYKYGSAWLKEKIPADVLAEIESWSVVTDTALTH